MGGAFRHFDKRILLQGRRRAAGARHAQLYRACKRRIPIPKQHSIPHGRPNILYRRRPDDKRYTPGKLQGRKLRRGQKPRKPQQANLLSKLTQPGQKCIFRSRTPYFSLVKLGSFAYVRIILFRIFDLLHSSFCLCLLRCMPICHTFSETRKDRFNAANPLHPLERVRF